jgi:hypothetical protein
MHITFEKLLENLKYARHFLIDDVVVYFHYDLEYSDDIIWLQDMKFFKEDNVNISVVNGNTAFLYLRHFHKRGTRQYETCTDQYGGEYVTEIQKTLETYDLVEYTLSILVKQPFT